MEKWTRITTVILALASVFTPVVWAQDTSSRTTNAGPERTPAVPQSATGMRARGMIGATTKPQNAGSSFDTRIAEMESCVTQMHAVLKQMESKTAAAKGPTATAEEIQMWKLLLGHLDRTLAAARVTELQRSAMYQKARGEQIQGNTASQGVQAETPSPVR